MVVDVRDVEIRAQVTADRTIDPEVELVLPRKALRVERREVRQVDVAIGIVVRAGDAGIRQTLAQREVRGELPRADEPRDAQVQPHRLSVFERTRAPRWRLL